MQQMRLGQLKMGRTVNLAAMARELKVSVTPIREALTQLQQAGIVTAVPNRGFVISELNRTEARELYDLIANLETMAMENATYPPALLQQMETSLAALGHVGEPDHRILMKFDFHRTLTRPYGNSLAQKIMEELRTRVIFYERSLLTDTDFSEKSTMQYEGIVAAIREENVPTAALILKMNWMLTLDAVQKRLPQE